MIETDYTFKKIEEYKEKILKEQIYSEYNVKKYESCPHCGCTHFIKHGKYEGIQRYRCKNDQCRKTFSSTTCSVWKYLKHKPEKWLKFIELMCENISLQRCADILNITISTAFYWRHKVFHGIENYYKPKSFKEHIVVSDFYTHKCYKGSRSKHFTKEQSLNNKISRLFAYVPNDVGILICVEGDEIPLINVKYEKEKLEQLSDEKTRQIKIYQGLVADNRQNVASYAVQIADQEKEVEAILQGGRDKISQSEKSGDTVQIMPTNGEYAWPLPVSGRITSTFGYRKAPTAGASSYHKGVDIAVNTGTNVLACKEGKVVTAAYSSSAGNYVAIYHGGGIYSYYMHCSQLKTSVGKHVEKGQVIARSGSTGISTGPHLHFAMYKSGNYVNPMYYVKQP